MIFYPHLKQNPADFKVALNVGIDDLGLTKEELDIFIEIVGPRFNQSKNECRITCDRFTNRIENKKYTIIMLERAVAESKRIRQCELLEENDPEAFEELLANTPKDDNLFDWDPDVEWIDERVEREETLKIVKKKLESLSGE